MKSGKLICILSLLILTSICVFQSIQKENIYIAFEDLNGYNYKFIDATDIKKTEKVVIKQGGKFYYQWWEVNVDTKKIKKSDFMKIRKLMINSQFFIINNYRHFGKDEKLLNKYRLHIIRWEKDIPYILPVKNVSIVME